MKIKNQKSKIKIFGLYIVILIFALYILNLFPTPVYAEVKIGEKFGFGGINSVGQAASLLVNPVFSIAATLVVIYFLYGAFKYLGSGADKEQVAGARGMITHAIIGFIILMFAFLILQFLLSRLFNVTGVLF